MKKFIVWRKEITEIGYLVEAETADKAEEKITYDDCDYIEYGYSEPYSEIIGVEEYED